jgi:hypothetical protein
VGEGVEANVEANAMRSGTEMVEMAARVMVAYGPRRRALTPAGGPGGPGGRRPFAGALAALAVVALAALLAGCGASAGTEAAPSNGAVHSALGPSSSGQPAAPAATAAGQPSTGGSSGQQQNLGPASYLIKSLEADLAMPDPRQTANDLRQWIIATDPRAQTAGLDYAQDGDNNYDVQMTFSVEASAYPAVQSYLANYAAGHHGRLIHLHEDVQDVTSEYVDLQSRLTNLRGEQQRLLDLLAHATNLSDTLAVEDRLTQVEGDIEQIEGRQNELNGQTTFYNVTINLSPLSATISTPHPTAWDPGGVFQAALGAAEAFGEFLASAAIWLGVFAIYALPVAVVVWLIRRWRVARKPRPSAS